VTPQSSKVVQGQSHESTRTIDLGIQYGSLSVIRSDIGREALSASVKSYFGDLEWSSTKLPNVGVAELIQTVETGGTHVHRSMIIQESGYSMI
jgi:hypothetical protein